MIPLNIPNLEFGNTMFVGVGGGYDIYGAIPLLESIPGNHILVSYASDKDFHFRKAILDDFPSFALTDAYEHVYVIGRHGVKLVTTALNEILKEHDIQTIVGIDGGVDSLMKGDEENTGTILEDFIVMAALDELPVKNKYLVNLGFGAEAEEGIEADTVFKNISDLSDHFLGSCSLTKNTAEFPKYKALCEFAWEFARKSHIQSRVLAAIDGNFGGHDIEGIDARLHEVAEKQADLNVLMGVYWFFDLNGVMAANKVIPHIRQSSVFTDALSLYRQFLSR